MLSAFIVCFNADNYSRSSKLTIGEFHSTFSNRCHFINSSNDPKTIEKRFNEIPSYVDRSSRYFLKSLCFRIESIHGGFFFMKLSEILLQSQIEYCHLHCLSTPQNIPHSTTSMYGEIESMHVRLFLLWHSSLLAWSAWLSVSKC
jgi:hypothetical protein